MNKPAVRCSTRPSILRDRPLVRRLVKLLRRIPSAVGSPWSWPVVLLVAVAVAGQWGGAKAAEIAAAACGVVGVGVVIGMTIAGHRGVPAPDADHPGTNRPQARQEAASSGPGPAPGGTAQDPRQGVDLRGARLVDTLLVHADLRQADLRGAIMTGADLSGADLSGARMGPLDDNPQGDRSA